MFGETTGRARVISLRKGQWGVGAQENRKGCNREGLGEPPAKKGHREPGTFFLAIF